MRLWNTIKDSRHNKPKFDWWVILILGVIFSPMVFIELFFDPAGAEWGALLSVLLFVVACIVMIYQWRSKADVKTLEEWDEEVP